jgi:hypothetical protein
MCPLDCVLWIVSFGLCHLPFSKALETKERCRRIWDEWPLAKVTGRLARGLFHLGR